MQTRSIVAVIAMLVSLISIGVSPHVTTAAEPGWAAPMREVHRKFNGTPMYVAKYGDSITVSRAFWSPVGWADLMSFIPDDGLPKSPRGKQWKQLINGVNDTDACGSGWTIDQLLPAARASLKKHKPQIAIIMIGTNDIRGNKVPDTYADRLERLVTECLAQGCVPILNTIPPRRDHAEAVAGANRIIKSIAEKHSVPLVDYHAAIISRRPEQWDGTLISKDGVHPSGGDTKDFSAENLRNSGYALRTWVNFMMVREVYFRVIAPKEAK